MPGYAGSLHDAIRGNSSRQSRSDHVGSDGERDDRMPNKCCADMLDLRPRTAITNRITDHRHHHCSVGQCHSQAGDLHHQRHLASGKQQRCSCDISRLSLLLSVIAMILSTLSDPPEKSQSTSLLVCLSCGSHDRTVKSNTSFI
jgi:hypothetical protein